MTDPMDIEDERRRGPKLHAVMKAIDAAIDAQGEIDCLDRAELLDRIADECEEYAGLIRECFLVDTDGTA